MISVGSEVQVLPGPPDFGGIAQLGEHLLCKQGVVGSNPSASTRMWRLKPVFVGLDWKIIEMKREERYPDIW